MQMSAFCGGGGEVTEKREGSGMHGSCLPFLLLPDLVLIVKY